MQLKAINHSNALQYTEDNFESKISRRILSKTIELKININYLIQTYISKLVLNKKEIHP